MSRRRRVIWGMVIVVAAVFVTVGAWVVIRGLVARDTLLGAVPLAGDARSAIAAGDAEGAHDAFDAIGDRAAYAATLTSDPIWRAAELVPWAGGNLRAFRESAAVINESAEQSLPLLGQLVEKFPLAAFAPQGGRFDLDQFDEAAPLLERARIALDASVDRAVDIDTGGTLPQISDAVDELRRTLEEAQDVVGALDDAATLLPPLLGADGPRDYLLLSLTNAELRATGGIPGAVAVIRADDGALTLLAHDTATAIGEFPAPVLPLTAGEQTLYDDFPARFMQNVTMTPDFARSGELAAAMWQQHTGQTVDGVAAVDPVALGYVLGALGPLQVDGVTLEGDNAAQILLNDAYLVLPQPPDEFFAHVVDAAIERLTDDIPEPGAFLGALLKGADEQRLHFWSRHPDEQERLDGSTLATAVPGGSDDLARMGVFFNDATAGKMGYYLRASIGVGSVLCRPDARPFYEVRVALTSTAPPDAATSLPPTVTGGGDHGVPPGEIRTNVYVFAPPGTFFYRVQRNGVDQAFTAADDGPSVAGLTVTIEPGAVAELSFSMLGLAGAPMTTELSHTPMASDVPTTVDAVLDCPVIPTPGGGDRAAIAEPEQGS